MKIMRGLLFAFSGLVWGGCQTSPTISPVTIATPGMSLQQAAAPPTPAVAAAQERVNTVGYKIVAGNAEMIQQLRPAWTVVTGDTPALRYEGERVYLTEGLVRTTATDGQLAALLSWTVGQIYSARQTRLTENAAAISVPPPEMFRVGNDGSGFNESDLSFQAQYQREIQLQKQRKLAQQPPPDPAVVARQVLVQGGYSVHELDSVQELMRQLPSAK